MIVMMIPRNNCCCQAVTGTPYTDFQYKKDLRVMQGIGIGILVLAALFYIGLKIGVVEL